MPERTHGSGSFEHQPSIYGGADAVPMGPDTPVQSEDPRGHARRDEQIHVRGGLRVFVLGALGLAAILALLAWLFLAVAY